MVTWRPKAFARAGRPPIPPGVDAASSMTRHQASWLALPGHDLLLGIVVTAVWGTNFVVIRLGLQSFPPLAFACLRFLLVFFPAMLFIRRPPIAWSRLAAYGTIAGGGQFGLLFVALRGPISPGLGSLVIQSQVFFTVGIAAFCGFERVGRPQVFAALIAVAGLLLIAVKGGGDATAVGLGLVLLAAVAWAIANILMRGATPGGMLAFIVWSSPFAVLPLLIMSIAFEGPCAILIASRAAGVGAWIAVLWQATGNTLFGFAAWGGLLQRHPASVVTPLALLVPIFGLGSAALLLGEHLQDWKVGAALLVLAGLGLNLSAKKAAIPARFPAEGGPRTE